MGNSLRHKDPDEGSCNLLLHSEASKASVFSVPPGDTASKTPHVPADIARARRARQAHQPSDWQWLPSADTPRSEGAGPPAAKDSQNICSHQFQNDTAPSRCG